MNNTVPRMLPLSFGERINDQSLGKTFIPVDRPPERLRGVGGILRAKTSSSYHRLKGHGKVD
jgi:hypothetical protein